LTGIKAESVLACSQPQNDTVIDCPQADESAKSFIVIAHNPKAVKHSHFLRVQLPKSNYKAEVWSKSQKKFVCQDNYDIIEQLHFTSNSSNDGSTVLDYTIFVDVTLEPNEVGFVRIVKTDKPFTFNPD